MRVLVTGVAGFIGFHTAKYLLLRGEEVVGIDNLNNYYDVQLKKDRLDVLNDLKKETSFAFNQLNIADRVGVTELFEKHDFQHVIHLAAQAGVRYSLLNPYAYVESNLVGFVNILENCRHTDVKHLTYASSSSVYGSNSVMPFSVHHNVDHPLSLYAATKKSNELMAHTYSHLYGLPTTGLRFFTVYGPWGRPDMALFKFVKAILSDEPIDIYNNGKMRRDFTYIDDVVEGVIRTNDDIPLANPHWESATPDPGSSAAPYKIYNIGNSQPIELMYLIELLEMNFGKKAKKNFLPMQAGDVLATYADVSDLTKDVGFKPSTSIDAGVESFCQWYREYYRV